MKILIYISMLLWGASSLAAPAVSEMDGFAQTVFQTVERNDFGAYLKLLHPDCRFLETSEKAFGLRSNVLKKLKPGYKIEAVSIAAYKELKVKSGNPRVDVYSVEPTHYAIVWPAEFLTSKTVRVDLNPLVKTKSSWKILDGSCVSSAVK